MMMICPKSKTCPEHCCPHYRGPDCNKTGSPKADCPACVPYITREQRLEAALREIANAVHADETWEEFTHRAIGLAKEALK